MEKKRRFAKMFNFWLDLNRKDESDLAETIGNLKQRRQFSQVIRDGLKIIPALLAGNPDPLFEKFPWVIDMVLARYGMPANAPTLGDNGNGGDNDLKQDLRRLEQLILKQSANPNPPTMMRGNLITSHMTLTAPDLGDFDFDLLEIKTAADAGKQSSDTFVRNLSALVSGKGAWAAAGTPSSRAGRGKKSVEMEAAL